MCVCSQAPTWARPCARHVATPIRNKYMHVAKHVHGLIPIRKIRFGLPKSGNTKVVARKRFIDMIMWIPNNGLDAI